MRDDDARAAADSACIHDAHTVDHNASRPGELQTIVAQAGRTSQRRPSRRFVGP